MLNAQEVHNLCNTSNQTKDKSINDYYAENIPYFNGINTFDIANVVDTDVETADDIYNESDEVELLQEMKAEIPKKMTDLKESCKFKKLLVDVLQYFANLLERVRASIRKFIDEIDNKYHWKNTGDEPPKEPRFYKQEQDTLDIFFDDDSRISKIVNKTHTAKKNRDKRTRQAIDNIIYSYEYEENQSNLFK